MQKLLLNQDEIKQILNENYKVIAKPLLKEIKPFKILSPSKRMNVYNKTNHCCYYCGKKIDWDQLNIDHIWPKSKGGTRDFENLAPVCRSCNSSKGTKTLEEYREFLIKKNLDKGANGAPYFTKKQIYYLENVYGIKIKLPSIKFYFEEMNNGTA